jgi:hypothetical protein
MSVSDQKNWFAHAFVESADARPRRITQTEGGSTRCRRVIGEYLSNRSSCARAGQSAEPAVSIRLRCQMLALARSGAVHKGR